MHALIAEYENLIVFTNNEGRIVDCFEFQRLSFTDSVKNLIREEHKDDDLLWKRPDSKSEKIRWEKVGVLITFTLKLTPHNDSTLYSILPERVIL